MTPVAPKQRAGGIRRRTVFGNKWFLRIASLVVVFSVWEWFGRDLPYTISDPISIVIAGSQRFVAQILPAIGQTLEGLGVGFGLALLIGIPLGLLMSISRVVELALSPYISAIYATPRVVLIPLLVIWLGASFQMRVGTVLISAVFPILLNVYLGGKEVDRGLIDVGRAFAASTPRIYLIVLRGSLPYVFTGVRLGLIRGLMGIIIAEILTASGGLGFEISSYAKYFHIDAVFAVVILVGAISMAFTAVITLMTQRTTTPWVYAERRANKQMKAVSR